LPRYNVVAASLALLASLSITREATATLGITALLASGFVPEGALADWFALLALLALTVATASGLVQLQLQGRVREPTLRPPAKRQVKEWVAVIFVVVVATGVALQTWFKVGTSVASGDITPPIGTAWIGRIFEPWVWTGSNLGETSQLAQDLPFAVVITAVHFLGGDAETAQRLYYTALYVGAAMSAVGLVAALGMRPLAGLVGASIYVFNP
jgi:hypothetical protein